MIDKIHEVQNDYIVINWRKLNDSKILTELELTILYKLIDKIDGHKKNKEKE